MKKLLLSLFLLLSCSAFAADPFMVIHPFRETFLHFPSPTLNKEGLVVTVFLPETSIPLTQKYPVVYALGLGPQQAQEIKKLQDSYDQKALIVGISLGENENATLEQISTFLSRELVPYIGVNYLTQDEPSSRALVVMGPQRAELAVHLMQKKDLFGRLGCSHCGDRAFSLEGASHNARILLVGRRSEVLPWQEMLEKMSYPYGAGFVTKILPDPIVEDAIDLDYFFAKDETVRVKKLAGALYPKKISLKEGKGFLNLSAVLQNGAVFDYIPLSVRMSPPYLDWNAESGVLSPISGAEAGKVKLGVSVDKVKFNAKIHLKK